MKAAMSGFDLRAVAQELNEFTGAYVKKAYMPHYEQIVLRINPKDIDQFDLVLVRGARIYTSKRDPDQKLRINLQGCFDPIHEGPLRQGVVDILRLF